MAIVTNVQRITDLVRKNNLIYYYDVKYDYSREIVICTKDINPTVISKVPFDGVREDVGKAIEKAELEIGLHQLLQ